MQASGSLLWGPLTAACGADGDSRKCARGGGRALGYARAQEDADLR
jgi:hypothetical protein